MDELKSEPWAEGEYKDPAANVRGMITEGEKRLLHWLAANWYQGRGEIVDLGCFVGADAISFADGLRNNPHRDSFPERPLIHAYDAFPRDAKSEADGSLIDEYWRNIAPYRDDILTYAGDVRGFAWPPARPIEILFNDISETAEINAFVIQEFFPRLIPGRSILIQQDYFDDLYWVPLCMEKLARNFEPFVGPCGATRAYLFRAPISVQALKAASRISWEEDLDHIRNVAKQFSGWYKQMFRLAEAKLYIRGTELDEAQSIVDDVRERYPDHRVLGRRIERIQRAIDLRRAA